MIMLTKARWFGWFSQEAVDAGCPVFTYRDKYNNTCLVTGVTNYNNGTGYNWSDKTFVRELTHMRGIKSSYQPHPDLYRM